MKATNRIEKQKELIETIGRYMEKQGYQPVAGRVLGMLMVMDKEEYTFDEIVEEMQISKSSASNALKNLELRNAIEYVTYPGDRKRYFRISISDISTLVDETERKVQAYADFISEIISLKTNPDSKNSKALKNILEGANFFLAKLNELRHPNGK
ncbi:MAG TPA: MarR family transcriptional regulator [Sunxiuqinia sp.]|nr:MarR family transcriptional regulator [Sunxiuqinia sp.]